MVNLSARPPGVAPGDVEFVGTGQAVVACETRVALKVLVSMMSAPAAR